MLFSGAEDEDVDELPELDHYYRSKAGTHHTHSLLLLADSHDDRGWGETWMEGLL
jgi:hypothetical protein